MLESNKLQFINTHSHVYTDAFDNDRNEVISRAIEHGITKILLPDIDSEHRERVLTLAKEYPENCIPMLGIHPTSVKENYKQEITLLEKALQENTVKAIGEIGIDLYWDTTFYKEQVEVLIHQIKLAQSYQLPIVIHVRNAFTEIFEVLESLKIEKYNGVFHCFSGNIDDALKAIDLGFYLGIGGVVTYKKSGLDEVVNAISLEHIVLETDDPWLPPVPYRGKRNEPSYLIPIAEKVAEIKQCTLEVVAEITSNNAIKLFDL